ncbi:pectate lyase [Microbulbifer litoralis]|uniref:pectate lyase n=1 Tax=Microbulbifer litoralis TaxID=2933965 RepID=UPI002028BE08|nr:pectate lyase [Microbulbifer sp. GX H0434]
MCTHRWLGLLLLAYAACSAGQPAALQPAQTLEAYRVLSAQLRESDRLSIASELRRTKVETPLPAPHARRFGFDPGAGVDFYRTAEGRRIADIVLSFQTPSGGWSKRTDMGEAARAPGQAYGVEENYIPTFDNGATSTQFWVMVNAYSATGDSRYGAAAERALRLILLAQYPNGGWPQSFPLRGGYHDLITFNDRVTSNLLRIVHAAAGDDARLGFLPDVLRAWARDSLQRGLQMLVEARVSGASGPAIWGAQHRPQSLEPASARAYEPVAMSTSESADLLLFLMDLEQPSPEIKRLVVSAHNWFAAHRISGYRWDRDEHDYRELLQDADADALWARFYEIGTDRPVFGDRDGSVHYRLSEISLERQRGYGWYTEHPGKVLKRFADWRRRHLR